MIRYFKKTLAQTRLFDAKGQPVPFRIFPGMVGLLELDTEDPKNTEQLALLDRFLARKVGGVSEVSQAEFEELKKKLAAPAKSLPSRPRMRLYEPVLKDLVGAGAPRAGGRVSARPATGTAPAPDAGEAALSPPANAALESIRKPQGRKVRTVKLPNTDA